MSVACTSISVLGRAQEDADIVGKRCAWVLRAITQLLRLVRECSGGMANALLYVRLCECGADKSDITRQRPILLLASVESTNQPTPMRDPFHLLLEVSRVPGNQLRDFRGDSFGTSGALVRAHVPIAFLPLIPPLRLALVVSGPAGAEQAVTKKQDLCGMLRPL
jgi:hypothetical protein